MSKPQHPNFRLTGKGFFLTWPKCTATKEEAMLVLQSKGPYEKAIVCHELHEDGTDHLHGFIKYEKKKNFKDPKCFDIGECHGNYQTAKSFVAVARYVMKGNDYIYEGESPDDQIRASENHTTVACVKALRGVRLTQIVEETPGSLMYFDKLERNLKLYNMMKERDRPTCEESIPNPWGKEMPLLKAKKRHYWIWSEKPDTGKTTQFLKPLMAKFRSRIQ